MDDLTAMNMFVLYVYMMCDWVIHLSFCHFLVFFSFEFRMCSISLCLECIGVCFSLGALNNTRPDSAVRHWEAGRRSVMIREENE